MTLRIWSRFVGKRKDGAELKLRIQDLPRNRIDEAIHLILKYFIRDEAVSRASGMSDTAQSVKENLEYIQQELPDPKTSVVICCSHESDEVKDILGLSAMCLMRSERDWDEIYDKMKNMSEQSKKTCDISHELELVFNPVKEYKLRLYYDDRAVLVMPDYRGYGIARELFKSRRLLCKAHNVPMTGAWMTAYGSQVAATRDGWVTKAEVNTEELAKRHNVNFADCPPTFKFMMATVDKNTN